MRSTESGLGGVVPSWDLSGVFSAASCYFISAALKYEFTGRILLGTNLDVIWYS